ncbi:hypothetical protein B0H10DRAFT_2437232 [Mycena sp. CBHHK59/15]|nr:hypothetical protein B0H10DRAFT_2437232 [Mycena sp. CBHHK59/15]
MLHLRVFDAAAYPPDRPPSFHDPHPPPRLLDQYAPIPRSFCDLLLDGSKNAMQHAVVKFHASGLSAAREGEVSLTPLSPSPSPVLSPFPLPFPADAPPPSLSLRPSSPPDARTLTGPAMSEQRHRLRRVGARNLRVSLSDTHDVVSDARDVVSDTTPPGCPLRLAPR